MNMHFEFTGETKVNIYGVKLARIKATQDLKLPHYVKKGDLGGWVQEGLTSTGDARVSGNAWVYGDAQVYGNARVSGDVHVDALDAIIVLIVAAHYSVTVTRKYIFAGCQQIKRKDALKLTKEKAVKLGMRAEYFEAYKLMVRGAMRIVKPAKKEK